MSILIDGLLFVDSDASGAELLLKARAPNPVRELSKLVDGNRRSGRLSAACSPPACYISRIPGAVLLSSLQAPAGSATALQINCGSWWR